MFDYDTHKFNIYTRYTDYTSIVYTEYKEKKMTTTINIYKINTSV